MNQGLSSYHFSREALGALAEASSAIISTLELQIVLNRIAEAAASVVRTEASSVLLYDGRRGKLMFVAAVGGQGSGLIGKEFDAHLGIAGAVLQSGHPAEIPDVSRDERFYQGIDAKTDFHTRGLIAAPMIFRSQPLGVIEVLNPIEGAFAPGDMDLLRVFANLAAASVHNAKAHETLKKENLALRSSLQTSGNIVGSCKSVKDMLKLADRVAPTHSTVLLTGETGTGKEVLAKYVHNHSPRAAKPFVAVNCAALPDTLLESELFGHEKGAFTGAMAQHIGRFELADEGTLFLDEIGDISASTQVKLLRLLQERAFTRVGGTTTISCDVRIIAATNRDLKKAISEESFREDLFYRLNVFPIRLPPLRDRRDDIVPLAMHFAKSASAQLGVPTRGLSTEAMDLLTKYDWPGNIRELSNIIERAALLCDGPEILPVHLPPEIVSGPDGKESGQSAPRGLRANERAMIVQALRENRWNQSKAARALGVSRDNLRYRMKKYNITDEDV